MRLGINTGGGDDDGMRQVFVKARAPVDGHFVLVASTPSRSMICGLNIDGRLKVATCPLEGCGHLCTDACGQCAPTDQPVGNSKPKLDSRVSHGRADASLAASDDVTGHVPQKVDGDWSAM